MTQPPGAPPPEAHPPEAQPPGWHPDPWARHEQRYHDGTAWTAHVVDGGTQHVDPLGATPVVPFVQRLGTTSGLRTFLDSLGPDARERPAPSLHTALAGSGGAVFAAGIVVALVGDDGSRGMAAVAGILLVAASLAVRLFLHRFVELAAAAVGAGAVGIAAIGIAIAGDNASSAVGFLVLGVLYLAAWALPGFRGRPLMLGLGALTLLFSLAAAAGSDGGSGDLDLDTLTGYEGTLLLLAAGVLLALVFLLDRSGYHGVATGLVAAALIAAAVGAASTVAQLDDTGGTLLIILVGAAVCVVGSHGERRATTWYGAAVAAIGVVAFFVAVVEPTSAGTVGAVVVTAGIVLIVAPLVIDAIKANRAKHAEPAAPAAFDPPTAP